MNYIGSLYVTFDLEKSVKGLSQKDLREGKKASKDTDAKIDRMIDLMSQAESLMSRSSRASPPAMIGGLGAGLAGGFLPLPMIPSGLSRSRKRNPVFSSQVSAMCKAIRKNGYGSEKDMYGDWHEENDGRITATVGVSSPVGSDPKDYHLRCYDEDLKFFTETKLRETLRAPDLIIEEVRAVLKYNGRLNDEEEKRFEKRLKDTLLNTYGVSEINEFEFSFAVNSLIIGVKGEDLSPYILSLKNIESIIDL